MLATRFSLGYSLSRHLLMAVLLVSGTVTAARADSVCTAGSLLAGDLTYNRALTNSTGTGIGTGAPGNCSVSGITTVRLDAYGFNLTGCATFPTQVIITNCGDQIAGSGCATVGAFDSVITLYRNPDLTPSAGVADPFNRNTACTNALAGSDDLSGTALTAGGATCDQLDTADCLTTCAAPGSSALSGMKRRLHSGHFVVVVAGFGNSTTGAYNLFVSAPAAGCVVTPEGTQTPVDLQEFTVGAGR